MRKKKGEGYAALLAATINLLTRAHVLGWEKVAAAVRQYEIMIYGAVATND